MSTLVYSPGIKVYIDTFKNGLLDVSDDLIGGTLTRRQDQPSSHNFSLNNARRKYDNVFMPNDRIVVMMKRLTWMRTYTGYLNKVPLFSAWPRVIDLTSTCSLKRLQYFLWDPGIEASRNLIKTSLLIPTDGSEYDGGIKQVVLNLLEQVVDWSGTGGAAVPANDGRALQKGKKVHIGQIPREWFEWAVKIAQEVRDNIADEQRIVEQLRASLGGSATVAGTAPPGGGSVIAGTYAGVAIDADQAVNADGILRACLARGVSARDMEFTIGCVMQESTLRNLEGGDRDSVGLFQQRPSQGWGTIAQCRNIEHATNKFLDGLLGIKGRESKPFTQVIQTVQRSGFPDAYAKWEGFARAVVSAFNSNAQTPTGDASGFPIPTAKDGAGPSGRGRADQNSFMNQGVALVTRNPNIRYQLGNDDHYTDPNPDVLDCSSFVQWVYYHTLGTIGGLPRKASHQYEWAVANGGQAIPADVGMQTPGALVFKTRNGQSSGIFHVEISLGTGHSTVGAHSTKGGVGIRKQVTNYYNLAVLLPGITYTQGAKPYYDIDSSEPRRSGDLPPRPGQSGFVGSGESGGTAPVSAENSLERQDTLFGSMPWNPAADEEANFLANSLVGPRALSNDTYILPYIQQLLGSCLRSFCSAPNGDFMAWFPDYYGLWGTAAKMVLQPIEVMDFTVDWDDAGLITHQFVTGVVDGSQMLSLQNGVLTNGVEAVLRFDSAGIATIDMPGIMSALFGLEQTADEAKQFRDAIFQRFGPRQNYEEVQGIIQGTGEFFYALYLFMQRWAYQYNANIPMTFMPELWPGMLIQMPFFNFQAYVNEVTHTYRFGPGGAFTTSVNIAAPARLDGKDNRLAGLPLAGGPNAGRRDINDPTFGTTRGGQRVDADGKTATERKLERLID